MKIDELRKIIHEEVTKAIREEVRDILVEAVDIASTPSQKKPVVEAKPVVASPVPSDYYLGLGSILQETARNMTKEDYTNSLAVASTKDIKESIIAEHITGPTVGISLDDIPFVSKAAAILESANQKDLERNGI